jgi:hypothetical protein
LGMRCQRWAFYGHGDMPVGVSDANQPGRIYPSKQHSSVKKADRASFATVWREVFVRRGNDDVMSAGILKYMKTFARADGEDYSRPPKFRTLVLSGNEKLRTGSQCAPSFPRRRQSGCATGSGTAAQQQRRRNNVDTWSALDIAPGEDWTQAIPVVGAAADAERPLLDGNRDRNYATVNRFGAERICSETGRCCDTQLAPDLVSGVWPSTIRQGDPTCSVVLTWLSSGTKKDSMSRPCRPFPVAIRRRSPLMS